MTVSNYLHYHKRILENWGEESAGSDDNLKSVGIIGKFSTNLARISKHPNLQRDFPRRGGEDLGVLKLWMPWQ